MRKNMYNENPFDAEFGGILELYLDFNDDAVKFAQRAHRLKKHPTYSLYYRGTRFRKNSFYEQSG